MKEISWLDELTQSTRELESPERFWYWAGVAAISAVIKRNGWLNRFSYNLYPNVYVILVSARSGLRKGVPVDYAKSIVEKVGNVRVISGATSVEGIIKELSQQRTLGNGMVISEAQALLCAPELKAYFVESDKALDILTDLHGTHEHEDEYKKLLKNSPVESLKKPYITLLGASNEVFFDEVIQKKDIEGGFIARSFIIYESKRRRFNSLTEAPEFIVSKAELARHLIDIANIPPGEFTWGVLAKKHYNTWYHKVAESSERTDDRTGTLERIGDQCLKLAMIVSLSHRLTKEITVDDIEESIIKCEEFYAGTNKVSMGKGASELAGATARVLKFLLAAEENQIERVKFLRLIWPDVDYVTFDRVIDNLGDVAGQGVVKIVRCSDKRLYYKLKPEVIDKYNNLLRGH